MQAVGGGIGSAESNLGVMRAVASFASLRTGPCPPHIAVVGSRPVRLAHGMHLVC